MAEEHKIRSDGETWDSMTESYVHYATKLVERAVQELLYMLDKPHFKRPESILDAGAGSGALTSAMTSRFPEAKILATDISPAMLAQLDAKTHSQVQTKVMDWSTSDISKSGFGTLQSESFDLVGSTFMLQFLPTPADHEAVKAFARVVKPGGAVALGIWGPRITNSEIFQQTCRKFDPDFVCPEFFAKGAMYTPDDLEASLKQAGLIKIEARKLQIPFQLGNAKAVRDLFQHIKNPAIGALRDSFNGANSEQFWDEFEMILLNEYNDAKDYFIEASFAVGFKE